MMKSAAFALMLTLSLGSGAFAQTVALPSAEQAEAAPDPSILAPDGKVRLDVVWAQCRARLANGRVPPAGLRAALEACVVQARPDKAVRIHCVMDPRAVGLVNEARRAFVQDCMARAGL